MRRIKILIAEDHKIVRKGFVKLLESFDFVDEIQEAANGKELQSVLKSFNPHIILMDLQMPDMDGLEATEYVVSRYPDIKIIALSFHDEERYINQMIGLGASGYILKDAEPEELIEAIQSVIEKDFYFNDITNKAMRSGIIHNATRPKFYSATPITEREKSILKYICQELPSKEIADKLCISTRTVEKARGHLIEKIGVKSTVGLVKYAIENGFDL